jgi:hypothetical protein
VISLFQLVLTVDAIRTRNTIQVVGLAIFNAMFLGYAGIQVSHLVQLYRRDTPRPPSLAGQGVQRPTLEDDF